MDVESRAREAELAFLNAPFENGGWLTAIGALEFASGSDLVQICGGGPGTSLAFNYFSNSRHDPHGHLHNAELYGSENWRIGVTAQARQIQWERDYAAYRAHHHTEYYDDAVSDLDVPFGCQSALLLDGNGMFGLAALRSARTGPCTTETLEVFARVARQAHRAVLCQLALGREGAEQMLAGIVDSSEMTLLLDRQGQLVAMTEAAETLFDCPIGLRLDGLAVRLADPAEDRALRAAFARLLARDRIEGPVFHEARAGRCSETPGGWWRVLVTRLPARPDQLGLEAELAVTLRPVPVR